jgi:Putative transposase of IS4/5 family (DUF4096)
MRYELSDYEWSVIKPMLPNKPRGIPRVDDRRILNGIFWVAIRCTMARSTKQLRSPYDLLQPLRSLASGTGSWMRWLLLMMRR